MIRRTVVTLAALLFIGAVSTGANEHTVRIRISQAVNLNAAHVFIGVAVLGPKVGDIERGWIVKKAGPGFLHIDWTRDGKWDGLTRTEQGPRDVTPAQMNSVIQGIESLGYPASAIRSWRVAAPVGYDGFGDGDKVLTIGQILVDLGTPGQARLALDRWWDVIGDDDKDPFEKLPHVNVRYNSSLFFAPDCDAMEQQLRADAVAKTHAVAQNGEQTDYQPSAAQNVLCPADRKPVFYNVDGGPPDQISDWDLSELQTAQVTYTLPGPPLQPGPSPAADDLGVSATQYEFPLAQRYAAMIGTASVPMKPDSLVVHFSYDLGTKVRKGYDADMRDVQAHVAALRQMVPGADIVVQQFPPQDREDRVSAFVLLHGADRQRLNDLQHAGARGNPADTIFYTALVADCDTAARDSVAQAVADSKRKAAMLAKLMHASLRGLGALRVTYPVGTNVLCGYRPGTSLSDVVPQIGYRNEVPVRLPVEISADATADAAWIISGARPPRASFVRAEYSANLSGYSTIGALENRALLQAWREAVVDDPHLASLYETQPYAYAGSDGKKASVSETIVVLRPQYER